jgi:hypothetical protein
MALSTVYKIGTATVTAGSTIVSGTGTLWRSAGLNAGDVFSLRGLSVGIERVNQDGEIVLVDAWPGETVVNSVYEIRLTPDATRVLTSSREALRRMAEGDLIDLTSVALAAGAPGSNPSYQNGVLTLPRGRNGAVSFGDLTIATGEAGSAVTYNDATGILSIPKGQTGDVTAAAAEAASRAEAAANALGANARRWEINGIMPRIIADWRNGSYATLDNDNLYPVTHDGVVSLTRATTAAITDRDGNAALVAAGLPALDFSQGGRGILIKAAAGEQATDVVKLPYFPQKGGALVEFYPPVLRGSGNPQGIISCDQSGSLRGVSASINPVTGTLILHIDDGTNPDLYQDTLLHPVSGLNRLMLMWDMTAGFMSYSFNGGPVYNFPAVADWAVLIPNQFFVGYQRTTGADPKSFEGVIGSVAVYDQNLAAPIAEGGVLEDTIRAATAIPTGYTLGTRAGVSRPFGDIYAEFTTSGRSGIVQYGDRHCRVVTRTGDYSATGDQSAHKVRNEFGDPIGWGPVTPLYATFEIFLPTLKLPGTWLNTGQTVPVWGLICQARQGFQTGYFAQPPFAIILDKGYAEAVVREYKTGTPTEFDETSSGALPISAGQWAKVEIYQTWNQGVGATGVCKLWVDEKLCLDFTGKMGVGVTDRVRMTMGVYRSESVEEWNDGVPAQMHAEYRNWRVSNANFGGSWDD